MGNTEIDAGMFMEYLQAQGRDRFRGDRYNSTLLFSPSLATRKIFIHIVFLFDGGLSIGAVLNFQFMMEHLVAGMTC